MNAPLKVAEPSAKYLAEAEPQLLRSFELLAGAPDGVKKLRELILSLAVRGKLVAQDAGDAPANLLLQGLTSPRTGRGNSGTNTIVDALAELGFPAASGWECVRLGTVFVLENGDRGKNYPSRSRFVDMGVPFINAGHLRNGAVRFDDMNYIAPQHFELLRSGKVRNGDIVFCLRGSLGKVAIVEGVERAAIASSLVIVRSPSCVDPKYALLFLSSPIATALVRRFDNGTAQPNLAATDLGRFPFLLPPLAEQRRIVARVEELMKLCDALEETGRLEAQQHARLVSALFDSLVASESPEELAENWARVAEHVDLLLDRPEAVDALEHTIIQLAVRGLLVAQDPKDLPGAILLEQVRAERGASGRRPNFPVSLDEAPCPLPEGWTWAPFGAVVNSSEAGWSPMCESFPRSGGAWGVLKVSAVSWGEFRAWENKQLPDALEPRQQYEVEAGDFLLSRANTADLVARSVVVKDVEPRLLLSDKIIRLRLSDYADPKFFNLVNNSQGARDYYAANASGTSSSMKNVSRDVILHLPVPIPSANEQRRIVARVEELRGLCAALRERLNAARTTQAHLADAMVESAAA